MIQKIERQSVIHPKSKRATVIYSMLPIAKKIEELRQMCAPEPMMYNGKKIQETGSISVIID